MGEAITSRRLFRENEREGKEKHVAAALGLRSAHEVNRHLSPLERRQPCFSTFLFLLQDDRRRVRSESVRGDGTMGMAIRISGAALWRAGHTAF